MAKRLEVALLILCTTFATALAEPKEADRLFTEGRELLNSSKFAEACSKFEAAIKLDPTATGTMLNLGLCYEKLGKFATSIRWFRKAQAAAYENKLKEYEDAAKEHTGTISKDVPTLNIMVDGPPDAEIRIDGVKVDPTEYGNYEIDPGTHQVFARAPGKKKVETSVELAVGERDKPLKIAFTEDAVPVLVDRGASRRKISIILGISGAVVLGGVTAYGFYQKHQFERTDKDAAGNSLRDPGAKDDLRTYGTSAFIVGAGLLTAGIVLYVTAPGMEQIADGTAFAPIVSPDQVGFAVSGAF